MPPPTRTPSLPGATFASKRQFRPPGPARSSGEPTQSTPAEPSRQVAATAAASSKPVSRYFSETMPTNVAGKSNDFRSAAMDLEVDMIISSSSSSSSSSDDENDEFASTRVRPEMEKGGFTRPFVAGAQVPAVPAKKAAPKPTAAKPKARPRPAIAKTTKPSAAKEAQQQQEQGQEPPAAKRQKPLPPPSLSPSSSPPPPVQQQQQLESSSSPGFEETTTNPSIPNLVEELDSETIPVIPGALLTRILHESYTDNSTTKIGKDAMTLMQRYMDIFVRETVARAVLAHPDATRKREEVENTLNGDGGEGRNNDEEGEVWLDVKELEDVAPGLVLDF